MSPISIKFPMVKEKTGNRTGPRFRRVVGTEGLSGAAGCAARMVCLAQLHRRQERTEKDPAAARWRRTMIRQSAYWARVFAGHLREVPIEIEIAARSAGVAMQAEFDERRARFEAKYPQFAEAA